MLKSIQISASFKRNLDGFISIFYDQYYSALLTLPAPEILWFTEGEPL